MDMFNTVKNSRTILIRKVKFGTHRHEPVAQALLESGSPFPMFSLLGIVPSIGEESLLLLEQVLWYQTRSTKQK